MNLSDQKIPIFRMRNHLAEAALTPALGPAEDPVSGEAEYAVPSLPKEPPVQAPPVEPPEPLVRKPKYQLWRAPFETPVPLPEEVKIEVAVPVRGPARGFLETCLKLALTGVVVALPGSLIYDLRAGVNSASEELLALKGKRSSILRHLREAESSRGETDAILAQRKLLQLELQSPRWTKTLLDIAKNSGAAVELLGIKARGQPDETGLSELRIDGICTATDAATAAEHFRQLLEKKLHSDFEPGRPKARIAKIKPDAPVSGEASGGTKAAFTIVVTSVLRTPNLPVRSAR